MCPAAAGGGGIVATRPGKNHAFCAMPRWAGQEARIQRYQLVAEGVPERDRLVAIRPRRNHVDRDVDE
jgi:hypothetical protein